MRSPTLTSQFDDMFRDINRVTVGFAPTLRMLDQKRTAQHGGYPPYDLECTGDNRYRLSMAVAGFTVDELDITLQDDILTIDGKSTPDETKTYLYKGIASRSFRKNFYLDTRVIVSGSNLTNGILTVDFVQELPESATPRKIDINSTE